MNQPPFDSSLPSPIAIILDLRASGQGAVVDAGGSSRLQDRMRFKTGLADALLDLARSADAPRLILITGSAGGGKSVLIDELIRRGPDAFGAWIEDATHSDSPTEDQMERLANFLAPLADGAGAHSGPPLLLAMNTGMVIRFFDQLRGARGLSHGFIELEETLLRRLAIDEPATGQQDLGSAVAVVNLDSRPTCGGSGTLFTSVLAALDPDDPAGILEGSPRCATCSVVEYCWPRTNAKLLSRPETASVVDQAAGAAARERGRWPSPRELWDTASELCTGGKVFPSADPCVDIAKAAAAEDGSLVWSHVLVTGLRSPQSRMASDIAARDPSYGVTERVHRILSSAGIDSTRDEAGIVGAFGGADVPALLTAAATIGAGAPIPSRPDVARALVRALWLAGEIELSTGSSALELFDAALAEYPNLGASSSMPAMEAFLNTVERGFEASFGQRLGNDAYYRTEAHDTARPVSVLARAAITDYVWAEPDPAVAANAAGAALVGHRPLAIDIYVAEVALSVSFPLFRLLAAATDGAVPSTQDLERFSSLKRAAEALGRQAAAVLDEPLMFVVAGPSNTVARYRASQRRDRFGSGQVTGVEDVSGH